MRESFLFKKNFNCGKIYIIYNLPSQPFLSVSSGVQSIHIVVQSPELFSPYKTDETIY